MHTHDRANYAKGGDHRHRASNEKEPIRHTHFLLRNSVHATPRMLTLDRRSGPKSAALSGPPLLRPWALSHPWWLDGAGKDQREHNTFAVVLGREPIAQRYSWWMS